MVKRINRVIAGNRCIRKYLYGGVRKGENFPEVFYKISVLTTL